MHMPATEVRWHHTSVPHTCCAHTFLTHCLPVRWQEPRSTTWRFIPWPGLVQNLAGAFVEYFGDILKDYGINTFHVVGISNESIAFSTSTFTQCCHEIALNNADICVGPFWPTDARMYSFLSHGLRFSSAVYEDEFKMVQNKVESQGLSSAWPLLVRA